MISKLVFKYLWKNLKRTFAAITSVILSVSLLTIASNVFVWGFQYMQKVEETTYGSWHARFNDLTKEQAETLTNRMEFAECELVKTDTGWRADIQLKEVNDDIFQFTQEIGAEIGMTSLREMGLEDIRPDGEAAEYDISYHMDLLEFYGLQYYNAQEASMRSLLWMLLAMIMGITALLIYSIFSLSFMEKKKYVGLLNCVGASLRQRLLFIFEEGLIVGVFSVPLGILAGSIGSFYVVKMFSGYLENKWKLGIALPFSLDFKLILLVAVLGMCTVFVAILIPTLQALRVNPLQLIYNPAETKPVRSKMKYYEKLPVECNIAVRNLLCNKKKAIKLLVFAALSIVVAFNGYIQIQHMRGEYLLEDTRKENSLDAWVSIYSDDFQAGENIASAIEKTSWCEEASYQSVFDIGAVVVEDEFVASDLKKFKLMWWGGENPFYFFRGNEQEKFYAFPFKIIGVEDAVFENYLESVNGKWVKDAKYPVILDDYIPVKNKGEAYPEFREVLDIPCGEEITIQYGKYADYFMGNEYIVRSKDKKVEISVCGVTSERAPIPIMPDAYGMSRVDLTQMPSYYVKAYMPYSAFLEFLQDESVKSAYGVLDEYDNPVKDVGENPILNYVTFVRNDEATEKQISDDLPEIMKDAGLRSYVSSYEEYYINDSNSWKYGNIENLERDELLRNATEILRRAFIVGGIVLILFFALFSLSNYILTSVHMRKREMVVFRSLGMEYTGLQKMLLYENGILILVSTFAGAIVAIGIAWNQFTEIKEGAATIEIHFPIGVFVGVIAGVLILTSMVSLVAVRKIKNVTHLIAIQ